MIFTLAKRLRLCTVTVRADIAVLQRLYLPGRRVSRKTAVTAPPLMIIKH